MNIKPVVSSSYFINSISFLTFEKARLLSVFLIPFYFLNFHPNNIYNPASIFLNHNPIK